MFGLSTHLTKSESSAAYLCSFFWIGLTIGRLLAIPQSMYFTSTAMVRFQLGLSMSMSIYFLYFPAVSYEETSLFSLLFGFAMSSLFPLMMIIVTDYGYVM
jgi:fucose permease